MNEPVGDDWKMFVHLEAPDSKKSHLNADHVPIGGKYPVSVWKKGEIIRDIHRVSVPATWPGNAVEIYVGAWKGPLRMKVDQRARTTPRTASLAVKLPTTSARKDDASARSSSRKQVKNGAIKLDGKLDEAAWKDAPSTGDVRAHDGRRAGRVRRPSAKLLWDDKNLYVAFEIEDKDVWTTLDKHDDKLWTQEAVEMFIDADGDGKTYVELQANPKGAMFDSYLPSYRENQNDWDSGMKVGGQGRRHASTSATTPTRAGWSRWRSRSRRRSGKEKEMKNVPPKVGTEWRVNFFRMDMPAGKPQPGTGWSPPMVGDFHALDKFGDARVRRRQGQGARRRWPRAGARPRRTTRRRRRRRPRAKYGREEGRSRRAAPRPTRPPRRKRPRRRVASRRSIAPK